VISRIQGEEVACARRGNVFSFFPIAARRWHFGWIGSQILVRVPEAFSLCLDEDRDLFLFLGLRKLAKILEAGKLRIFHKNFLLKMMAMANGENHCSTSLLRTLAGPLDPRSLC
jgi:hypothetical protein